jgi:hypothetical protein
LNAREIWEDFLTRTGLPVETAEEVALQKWAFVCGLARACGGLIQGEDPHEMLEGARELTEEAARDLYLMADRKGTT